MPNASEIAQHLGRRIQERRTQLGLSQSELGQRVDLRFQQIQKYEHGRNQITAPRLYQLARALDLSVADLFDGLADSPEETPGQQAGHNLDLEMARLFQSLPSVPLKRALTEVVRHVAETADAPAGSSHHRDTGRKNG